MLMTRTSDTSKSCNMSSRDGRARGSEPIVRAWIRQSHSLCTVLLHTVGATLWLTDYQTFSLSHHFKGHFQGGPGLAGTRMSPFWILLELRMMEVVVTTGAIRNHHHQQTKIQFYTDWMSFLSPNQQCQSTVGKLCVELLLPVSNACWETECCTVRL